MSQSDLPPKSWPSSAPQWSQPPVQVQADRQQPIRQQPATQPPKKKSRRGIWIAGVVVVVVIVIISIAAAGHGSPQPAASTTPATSQRSTQAANQPTSQPTQPPAQQTWTTTRTFTGNGAKKTAIFTAPGDWKILYSCTYQNIDGVTADGLLTVSVYGSDGSLVDPAAINATCKNGVAKTTGETEEHQGGQVYLDINGTGDWTVQVQELK